MFFRSKEVSYLGFRLTEEGIKPGTDKLKAVKNASPPPSVHKVRQWLGLCNFFRGHVRNFAQLTSPSTALTKKECAWKGGQLPPESFKAFQKIQTFLCSEPVVDYPRRNRPYAQIVNARLGDDKKPGGLGTIFTQVNQDGASLHMAAECCKRTNATTHHFCWKFKLPFGGFLHLSARQKIYFDYPSLALRKIGQSAHKNS